MQVIIWLFLALSNGPKIGHCPVLLGVASIGEKRDAQLIPTSRVMRKALAKQRENYVDRGRICSFWSNLFGDKTNSTSMLKHA